MVVQHNLTAINANRYLGINNSKLGKSLEKLSSGFAINRAGDNAAGLAVSEKMRSQIAGMEQGVKNAQDGISMVQTFEGALTETDSILQRMKTLATQSANGTYDDSVDRAAIQLEFDQLNDELNQIADTDFNGVVALNGGQMADGLVADGNGKIDYSNATRQAQQLGTTGGFVKGVGADGYTGTKEEIVTFTAEVNDNGEVTWTPSDNAEGTVGTEKNGGFTYSGATVNIDTTKIVTGDTITIKFSPAEEANAVTSEVVGSNTDMGKLVEADDTNFAGPTLDIEDDVVVSQEIADAVNALNGLTVTSALGATNATVTTKVNNVAIPADANPVDLGISVGEGKLQLAQGGVINYVDAAGTATKIATVKAATADAKAAVAGTATTSFLVTQSSYEAAKAADIEIVEPESVVSQSDAYDKSTAILTYADDITLQVGGRAKDAVNFTFAYESDGLGELKANLNCSSRADGLNTANLSLKTQESANAAIDKIDNAINKVSMVRATFGAMQNRLEHKIDNMNVTVENLTSAESRIRDTDMATEMMNFTKQNILTQASQSMLAQANQLPQSVLSLLQ